MKISYKLLCKDIDSETGGTRFFCDMKEVLQEKNKIRLPSCSRILFVAVYNAFRYFAFGNALVFIFTNHTPHNQKRVIAVKSVSVF